MTRFVCRDCTLNNQIHVQGPVNPKKDAGSFLLRTNNKYFCTQL